MIVSIPAELRQTLLFLYQAIPDTFPRFMHIFKIVFINQGKVYEIYAKTIRQGDLYGFVEIEDLIFELKKEWTVIIVTHNMQQAARISDYTGFMYLGELIEYGDTTQIFENPHEKLTENYITGRFG